MHRRVRKRFCVRREYKFFYGTVMSFNPELRCYRIVYDDKDKEDVNINELKTLLFTGTFE
jgi:hypothetical protein